MRHSWLPISLLLAAFLAFVGIAVGAWRSLDELLVHDVQRRQSLGTQVDLQRLLTLLVDVETAQRGFIITGQQPFLRPYNDALAGLDTLYTGLRPRLAHDSASASSLERLDALIQLRLDQARKIIARRMELGDAVLRDLGSYAEGRRVMDDIRFEIDHFADSQRRTVAQADEAMSALQRRTTRLGRSLLAAGLVTLALALVLMFRERRLRDRAEVRLRDANAGLEKQVQQRTEALSRALTRIRSFAVELDRGIEAERRRLAREVHDQVGQVGTAIKMLTIALRAKLAPRTEPLVDELQEMADEAIRAARQISAALRPPLLDELGLEAALGHYLQTLQRQSGLTTSLALDAGDCLGAEQANPLFRVVQEACTNVLRHAAASALRVQGRPWAEGDDDGYELEIIDNGRGPGDVRADASGLRGMRERAALAGGRLDFGPALGGGARVRVWLPLQLPEPQGREQEEETWS